MLGQTLLLDIFEFLRQNSKIFNIKKYPKLEFSYQNSTNFRILYKNGSLEQCGQGKMIFSSCFCGHQQDWQRDFSSVASKIGRKIEIS